MRALPIGTYAVRPPAAILIATLAMNGYVYSFVRSQVLVTHTGLERTRRSAPALPPALQTVRSTGPITLAHTVSLRAALLSSSTLSPPALRPTLGRAFISWRLTRRTSCSSP